jgi:hypothetical protein
MFRHYIQTASQPSRPRGNRRARRSPGRRCPLRLEALVARDVPP